MPRTVVHLDADAFFASVEQAADPRLRGKPVAVGGEKRGIIASASYEARQFGVFTPMPTVRARKLCPRLIVLPGDFDKYEQFSRWMFAYAYDFTPDVEIASIDEGYFDLSGARQSPVEIAQIIRDAIGQSLKISVSEGIASNKLVSQIASKLHKPGAFERIAAGQEIPFLHPLPNRWLPGVGPKTAVRLNAAGLARIGQIAATPFEMLELLLGKLARALKEFANGFDERPIVPARDPAKSYGQQETFSADTTDEDYVDAVLHRMADQLMAKVRADHKSVRTVTVKVRYNDMAEDQCGESLIEPTDLETDIYSRLRPLWRQAWKRRVSLRMVSLKFSNVYEGIFHVELPLERAAQTQAARRRLAGVVDELRQLHGSRAIFRGHDFVLQHRPRPSSSSSCAHSVATTDSRTRTRDEDEHDAGGLDKEKNSQHSQALFPLTPALSPKERENHIQRWSNTRRGIFSTKRKTILPLPKGEGRGEGERDQRTSAAKFSSLAKERKSIEPSPTRSQEHRPRPSSSSSCSAVSFSRTRTRDEDEHSAAGILHTRDRRKACSTFYIPLNVHSYYSFLNSTLSPEAIVALAKRHGLPAIALTDTGNLHGAVAFAQAAKAAGVKPIFGAEIQMEGKALWLYVQNATGYANLCRILSVASARTQNGMSNDQCPITKEIPSISQSDSKFVPSVAAVLNDAPLAKTGFSLTPLERENRRQHTSESGNSVRVEGRSVFHPLPLGGGEGRGEGDGSVGYAKRHASDEEKFQNCLASPQSLDIGHTDGLIAVSADTRLAKLFPNRFYLAVSSPDELRGFAPQTNLPRIAVPPAHYASADDRWKFDIVQSIRTLTLLKQSHPEKKLDGEFHFRSPAAMRADFEDHPDLLANTLELAERCTFELPLGPPQFPAFTPPDGSTPKEFLRRLVLHGLQERYGSGATEYGIRNSKFQISNPQSQIEEELAIISDVGYEEYFLMVWDILQTCRQRGIDWITRGSAADSLVCYCLGISNVCPIRFDLYFRRFLNKDRMALNKLPDIDVDFPHDRKDDVLDLIFEKYGAERCAVVGGFSTFQARSAFAEVAKVLGVAERDVRRFTEHFPWSFGGGWEMQESAPRARSSSSSSSSKIGPSTRTKDEDEDEEANHLLQILRASPECRDLPLDEEPYRTALQMAQFLDGFPRYPKMHPCGVVLARQLMHELTPTFVSHKGYPTTHFDMDAVEAIGLVKIDILAQGGLAAMRDVKAMLRARGVEVDLERFIVSTLPARSFSSSSSSSSLVLENKTTEDEDEGRGRSSKLQIPNPKETPSSKSQTDPRTARNLEVGPWNLSRACRLSLGASSSPATLSQAAFDDPAVWDMIASGGARAVHHIESPAMTSLCRMCNVRDIDGLIAIVSVIRPGAANEQKKVRFTRRYQGLEPVTYPHPSLERCLKSTYGMVVYEEHILQICEAFAGIPPGRADILRRALNKQKQPVIDEIGKEFFTAARARGHDALKIAEVWELVTGFTGYAFCKAHSTAYGVEAYQSAWLKKYFPAEFMAAVLTNGKGFYHPIVYVLECHRLGIPLLPPWVNEPGPGFAVAKRDWARAFAHRFPLTPALSPEERENRRQSVRQTEALGLVERPDAGLPLPKGEGRGEGEGVAPAASDRSIARTSAFCLQPSAFIRVPVTYVKGLTERTKQRLLEERARGEFASLQDFYRRVLPSPEDMEILIRVGAFDGFGQTRTAQFWEAQFLQRAYGSNVEPGQGWLFTENEECRMKNAELTLAAPPLTSVSAFCLLPSAFPEFTEPTRRERLQWEMELLDFPASGHPLEFYDDIDWASYCPVAKLGEHVGAQIVTCGLIIEQRVHHQVTGEPMKFLTLADWTGIVETELFAATYRSYGLATVRYPVLEITATVEPFDNGHGFTLRVQRAGKPRTKGLRPKSA